MRTLICGSVAYDNIMAFQGQFKKRILAEELDKLNVVFLVPTIRREFGGCAGNIAYNLKLLGENPFIMATVGKDFEPYSKWLNTCNISTKYIKIVHDAYTSQAYITTDQDSNQITTFHPGAMNLSQLNSVPIDKNISIGIVSPDGKQGMQIHSKEFAEQNIPFIFDPGQGITMFNRDELLALLELSTYATFNYYESVLMQKLTGMTLKQLSSKVEALIVTMGDMGSKIFIKDKCIDIASVKASKLSDPTGCGDAYRAGLLYGILHKYNWEVIGKIASLLGAIKIAHHGTQNHSLTLDSFKQLYFKNFSSNL